MDSYTKNLIRIKTRYDRQLKQVEGSIPIYEISANHELRIMSKSLIAERDDLLIILGALEKRIPLLAHYDCNDEFLCPSCGFEDGGYDVTNLNVCPNCGQKLEWNQC